MTASSTRHPDLLSNPASWGPIPATFREALDGMAGATEWQTIMDSLRDPDLCITLLKLVYHTIPPYELKKYQIEPPKNTFSENYWQQQRSETEGGKPINKAWWEKQTFIAETEIYQDEVLTEEYLELLKTQQEQDEKISLTEIRKQLKETKDTLQQIEAKLHSKSNPKSDRKQNPAKQKKPKITQAQAKPQTAKRTPESKQPKCNPVREVVVTGITYSPDEDLEEIIKKIAKAKGIEVKDGDIIRSFRALNKDIKQKATKSPKIIVEWATNKMTQDFKRTSIPRWCERGTTVLHQREPEPRPKLPVLQSKTIQKKAHRQVLSCLDSRRQCYLRTTAGHKFKVTSEVDLQAAIKPKPVE